MDELEVRLVKLGPMRVASFLGFGESPEEEAWEKLFAWTKSRGIDDLKEHRLFGFNNPNPSPGSPNYGYEVWIEMDPGTQAGEGVNVLDFDGGLYAVTACVVPKGQFEVIGATWKKLVAWREDSPYKCGSHQWLEESLPRELPDTEFVLDLYLPVTA